MSLLISQAAMVSRVAHQAVGQKRKYTGEPGLFQEAWDLTEQLRTKHE